MTKTCSTLILSLLLSAPSWAATISQLKGTRALIDLEGAETTPGDEYFVLNARNKKVAVLRIRQVKDRKAIAEILKGKPEVGFSLQAKASGTEQKNTSESSSPARNAETEDNSSSGTRDVSYSRTLKSSFGILGEYFMNSMQVAVKDALNSRDSVSMAGSSFGVGAYYEYILTRDISLRLLGALEQFNATGTSAVAGCDSKTSKNCDTKIIYASAYGLGKYYFLQSKLRAWAGAGGGFLMAVSKSSTALNESGISSNQVLALAVGGDWQLSRKTYIPFSIEYNYFPPSDTVKATNIALKVGYGWQ